MTDKHWKTNDYDAAHLRLLGDQSKTAPSPKRYGLTPKQAEARRAKVEEWIRLAAARMLVASITGDDITDVEIDRGSDVDIRS